MIKPLKIIKNKDRDKIIAPLMTYSGSYCFIWYFLKLFKYFRNVSVLVNKYFMSFFK